MTRIKHISAANIYWDMRSEMPRLNYRAMKVVERAEIWRPATEYRPPIFSESLTIWYAEGVFYLQYSPNKYNESGDYICVSDGDIYSVDCPHPSIRGDFVIAEDSEHRYIEQPTCIEWDFRDGPRVMHPSDAFRRHYEVAHCLLEAPHRNVSEFFGCTSDWWWMDRLVFKQYERSLADSGVDEIEALNADQILEGIKNGIKHLHSLEIMHQAIYPKNIRLDGQGRPVICNFRNADWEGQALSYESIELIELAYDIYSRNMNGESKDPYAPGEYFHWIEEDHPCTHPDIDYFGLVIIRDFLRNPTRYDALNSSVRKIYWDCYNRGHLGRHCCEWEDGGRDFGAEERALEYEAYLRSIDDEAMNRAAEAEAAVGENNGGEDAVDESTDEEDDEDAEESEEANMDGEDKNACGEDENTDGEEEVTCSEDGSTSGEDENVVGADENAGVEDREDESLGSKEEDKTKKPDVQEGETPNPNKADDQAVLHWMEQISCKQILKP